MVADRVSRLVCRVSQNFFGRYLVEVKYMDTAKVFVTGRSQAVRLPKRYRFDADEVCIARVGELVVL